MQPCRYTWIEIDSADEAVVEDMIGTDRWDMRVRPGWIFGLARAADPKDDGTPVACEQTQRNRMLRSR